jgi:hypothetical protein
LSEQRLGTLTSRAGLRSCFSMLCGPFSILFRRVDELMLLLTTEYLRNQNTRQTSMRQPAAAGTTRFVRACHGHITESLRHGVLSFYAKHDSALRGAQATVYATPTAVAAQAALSRQHIPSTGAS